MKTKFLALGALDLKMSEEADGVMSFEGYASVFGGVDAYGDTIDPKAYDKTINLKKRDRPIRMRWNHYGPVIGKWTEIRTDEKGLFVKGVLTPGHSVATDVYASLKHGAIDGMSIGYMPKKIEVLEEGKRLLKEIELIEISVVEEPADLGAKVNDVKNALDACSTLKEVESILRESGGFSKTDAVSLVARIKTLARGEHDAEQRQKEEIARMFGVSL